MLPVTATQPRKVSRQRTGKLPPQNRAMVDNEVRLIEKLLKTGFSLR
jgi:hypothetical protein